MQEYQTMVVRSLDYYSGKLAKVRADDENRLVSATLNHDVNDLTAQCNEAIKLVKYEEDDTFHDLLRKHSKLVLDALNVYAKDLQFAKAKFYYKLGASPDMIHIDSDVKFAMEMREEFTKLTKAL